VAILAARALSKVVKLVAEKSSELAGFQLQLAAVLPATLNRLKAVYAAVTPAPMAVASVSIRAVRINQGRVQHVGVAVDSQSPV
jgi:hypothetical protein